MQKKVDVIRRGCKFNLVPQIFMEWLLCARQGHRVLVVREPCQWGAVPRGRTQTRACGYRKWSTPMGTIPIPDLGPPGRLLGGTSKLSRMRTFDLEEVGSPAVQDLTPSKAPQREPVSKVSETWATSLWQELEKTEEENVFPSTCKVTGTSDLALGSAELPLQRGGLVF